MSAGTVLIENTRTTRHPTISVLVLAAQSPYKAERTCLPPLLLLALSILKLWPQTCLRCKGFGGEFSLGLLRGKRRPDGDLKGTNR